MQNMNTITETPMNRAARVPIASSLLVLALALSAPAAHAAPAAPTTDSSKTSAPAAPTAKAVGAFLQAAPKAAAAAPTAVAPAIKAAVKAVTPAPAVSPAPATAPAPAPTVPAPTSTRPVPVSTPPVPSPSSPRPDSLSARAFKIGKRPFSREEAKQLLAVLNFKPKGKPESTAVNWIYRDERGALLTYGKDNSEWAYAYDTVAVLDPKEYVPDSLIRTKTDGLLKEFLKARSASYAFVNYEKTMVQPRDEKSKEGVGPAVPAYYIGRYLRKLDGRFVLGDNFQVRIGVGRANAPVFISYRNPVLTDSSRTVTVPSKEYVEAYLLKWGKDKTRLGRQYYPYHPERLRIKTLKPVKAFEAYVLTQEKFRDNPGKDGTYLVPRVTVLAEAVLAKSTKRLKVEEPAAPVLLHFHFPCTPGAGLCWPDGKQGLEGGPIATTATQPPPATHNNPPKAP